MAKNPSISSAEWAVMQVLWRRAPQTAIEVSEALAGQVDWHPKTVRTLLGRLLAKGAVRRKKESGAFRFWPEVTETDCLREESQSFLERCFGGSPVPLLAHFIEREDLSDDDIQALRAMLDARSGGEKSHD
ncbi:MAG: BlaI family transcriptional regulator [Candidatus Hydrogenedentota bacterium]